MTLALERLNSMRCMQAVGCCNNGYVNVEIRVKQLFKRIKELGMKFFLGIFLTRGIGIATPASTACG